MLGIRPKFHGIKQQIQILQSRPRLHQERTVRGRDLLEGITKTGEGMKEMTTAQISVENGTMIQMSQMIHFSIFRGVVSHVPSSNAILQNIRAGHVDILVLQVFTGLSKFLQNLFMSLLISCREHLYRCHIIIHCKRCRQIFKTESELENHQRQTEPCQIGESELPEGLYSRQVARLKSKKKFGNERTDRERWMVIYHFLFPDEDATLVSPCKFFRAEERFDG